MSYLQTTRMETAKSALLALAASEQKFYSTNMAYTTNPADLGYTAFPAYIPNSSEAYYKIAAPVLSTNPAGFTISAQPVGSQAGDSCGTLILNSLGVESSTGTNQDCW
nr:type IV pilin protein [Acidithiobacillus ferrooxidans]